MPSNKPRIATYTDDDTVKKFKVVAAYHDMSMSEFTHYLIKKAIENHEKENGIICIKTLDSTPLA